MSTTENNAKLLELNYNAQLAALREIGLLGATETIPLGEIADYMKWAGGLLDVQLAKVYKSDGPDKGKLFLFTTDEWDALSTNQQGNYLTLGVCVRAERQRFLISKSDMKTDGGAYTMLWSSERINVPNLTDYGPDSTGIYEDFDAAGMTDAIVTVAEARGVAYLPAQLSRAYKACTAENDGVDDPVVWSMATLAHLRIMSKYRSQINAVISTYIGSSYQLQSDWYWSANEYSADYAHRIHLGSGCVNNNYYKNYHNYRVRAVSAL